MTSPQPMQMRRRGGAKRGDHGSYVAPAAETPAAPQPKKPATSTKPSGERRTDTRRSAVAASGSRRVGKPISEAAAAAKAAYDAKPKVIFRGVDEDVYFKLRAIYKHQLRSSDGIEGWSEFGRQMLRDYVEQYEHTHGEMTGGKDVELPAGRRLGSSP